VNLSLNLRVWVSIYHNNKSDRQTKHKFLWQFTKIMRYAFAILSEAEAQMETYADVYSYVKHARKSTSKYIVDVVRG